MFYDMELHPDPDSLAGGGDFDQEWYPGAPPTGTDGTFYDPAAEPYPGADGPWPTAESRPDLTPDQRLNAQLRRVQEARGVPYHVAEQLSRD